MDPYRDERASLDARLADAERRATEAEQRAHHAERTLRTLRRKLALDTLAIVIGMGAVFTGLVLLVSEFRGGEALPLGICMMLGGLVPVVLVKLMIRSGPDEVTVIRHGEANLTFLPPGKIGVGLGRHRLGALPVERATVQRRALGVPCRDGTVDLQLTAMAGIGEDHERRERAVIHFLDRRAVDVGDAAAPLIEAALRSVVAARTRAEVLTGTDRVGLDIKMSAQAALRELGLELGELRLAPYGGRVEPLG